MALQPDPIQRNIGLSIVANANGKKCQIWKIVVNLEVERFRQRCFRYCSGYLEMLSQRAEFSGGITHLRLDEVEEHSGMFLPS
jgi:hypothetical protein